MTAQARTRGSFACRWLLVPVTVAGIWQPAAFSQQPASPNLIVQDDARAKNSFLTSDSEQGISVGGRGKWAVADGLLIFDMGSGRFSRRIPVSDMVAFEANPVFDQVAVLAANGSIVMVDITTGDAVWRSRPVWSYREPGTGRLAFTADGSTVAAVLTGKKAYAGRWDARTGEVIGKGWSGKSEIMSISRDATWYSRDSELFDLATGKSVRKLAAAVVASHAGARRAVRARPSKTGYSPLCLVDVESDNELLCWSVSTPGGLVIGFEPAVFSPDGQRLIIGADGRVIDTAPADVVGKVTPGARWGFGASGDTVVAVDGVRAIARSVEPDKTPAAADMPHADSMTMKSGGGLAAFTADGRFLVVLSSDGLAYVWDTSSGERLPYRLPARMVPFGGRLSVRPAATVDGAPSAWPHVEVVTHETGLVAGSMRRSMRALREMTRSPRLPAAAKQNLAASLGTLDSAYLAGMDARACVSANHEFEVVRDPSAAVARVRATADGRVVTDVDQRLNLDDGCSISHDGKRLVVSGRPPAAAPPGTPPDSPATPSKSGRALGILGRGLVGVVRPSERSQSPGTDDDASGPRFEPQPGPLIVHDLASRNAVAQLQDASGRSGSFALWADQILWSPDGRFLVGQISDRRAGGRPTLIWEAGSGRQIAHQIDGGGMVQGFVPDASAELVVWPGGAMDAEVWALDPVRLKRRIADGFGWEVAARNGTVSVGGAMGALRIRNAATAETLGELRILDGGEWLVTTPSGLFDGSPAGWRVLSWRATKGMEVGNGELFFNEYYEPGLLAQLLRGQSPRPVRAIAERDRRQPTLEIDARTAAKTGSAIVGIRVREAGATAERATGSGVRDLRLFRNGALVRTWRGDLALDASGTAALETTVPLAAGQNTLTAYAFNSDDVKSADATATVENPAPPHTPTTYVLAVGINRYAQPGLDLRYAVADAKALASALEQRQRALGDNRDVHTVTLLDENATAANISLAIERLAGTRGGALPAGTPAAIATLPAATPEDTVVVYFAGHGVARGDRFHLIPWDARATAPAGTQAAVEQILARSLTDRDLERLFEPIDARHFALIIDACQSGQALTSPDERFGPMNSRGLAQLAYEKGMSILVASQAYQAALESSQLGHGFLTFALTKEGLETSVADRLPTDGQLTVVEWFAHAVQRVPELQAAALDAAKAQGRALRFAPEASGLQTPRVFTKRDASGPPLVIARP